MISQTELVEQLQGFAQTFGFLSQALLHELNDEAIAQLASQEWPRDEADEHLDRGYALLRRYFKFSVGDRREQLAVDYARIFLAAGVHAKEKRTAVPYESVFTGEEHLMMGDARDDVVRVFREDGFVVDPALHEPEDHLGFELEYLAHMNERAAEAARAHDAAVLRLNVARQREFACGHVLNWLPELASAVDEFAQTTFYPGLLQVAWGAVRELLTMLDEIEAQQG